MIQQQTKLKVIDNSGAKIVKCIKVLGGFKKKHAKIGDSIIVSVQKIKSKSIKKIKKGEVCTAVIIKLKKKSLRQNGLGVKFDFNTVVLFTKTNSLLFTRIFSKIPRELRVKKMLKLYSLSMGTY